MNIEQEIKELYMKSICAETPNAKFLVHGVWTGVSQGHTTNCYGFSTIELAERYASLLNKKDNTTKRNGYIVSKNPRMSFGKI